MAGARADNHHSRGQVRRLPLIQPRMGDFSENLHSIIRQIVILTLSYEPSTRNYGFRWNPDGWGGECPLPKLLTNPIHPRTRYAKTLQTERSHRDLGAIGMAFRPPTRIARHL